MIVYKITNIINGKLYFGITKCTIQKRWREHKCAGKTQNKRSIIGNAIKKYGHENFKIEIVNLCETESEMYGLEIKYIKEFQTTNRQFGYNNSAGGEISMLGFKHSEESKFRMSKIQSGIKRKQRSEATKEKMRQIMSGRKLPKWVVEKSAASRRGKPAHNRKPVYKYDLNDNLIIRYESLTLANKEVNGILKAFNMLRSGRLKTYKGFKWKSEVVK